MGLDPTTKEMNFKDSVRKFLYEQIALPPSLIPLSFDSGEAVPDGAAPSEESTWVVVNFGGVILGPLMEGQITITIAGSMNLDADNVTLTRDIVVGSFYGSNWIDGMVKIPFYNELNLPDGNPNPDTEIITYMNPEIVFESPLQKAVDGTKYKTITVSFIWGSKN